MKKTTLTITVLGIFAFAATGAIAGDKWEAKMEAKFTAIDANGDGGVSEAEYLAYKAEKARSSFAEISGDDGVLTLAEAKAARKAEYAKKRKKKRTDSE